MGEGDGNINDFDYAFFSYRNVVYINGLKWFPNKRKQDIKKNKNLHKSLSRKRAPRGTVKGVKIAKFGKDGKRRFCILFN